MVKRPKLYQGGAFDAAVIFWTLKNPAQIFLRLRVLNGVCIMKKVCFVLRGEEYDALLKYRENIISSVGFQISVSELIRKVVMSEARKIEE